MTKTTIALWLIPFDPTLYSFEHAGLILVHLPNTYIDWQKILDVLYLYVCLRNMCSYSSIGLEGKATLCHAYVLSSIFKAN